MNAERGFTLLEVLISLAVTATVLAAVLASAATAARAERLLKDRTLAHWVASNVMADVELREPWPPLGVRAGEAHMAGRTWRWRRETTAGTYRGDAVRKVQVVVESGATRALLTRSFYPPNQP